MAFRPCVLLGLLCLSTHAGCTQTRAPSVQRIQTQSPHSSPPAVPVIAAPETCPSIDPALLAHARPMTLENPDQLAYRFGQLTLSTSYPYGISGTGLEPLQPLRFSELSEAEAAAAENIASRGSEVRVWLDERDGTSRPAQISEAPIGHSEAYAVYIEAVLRPTTRAIRALRNDRLIEKLERPEFPPQIEALVLRDRPLQIAVRVRGLGSPMRLELREDLKGEPTAMAYANESIYPKRRGDYPCWVVFPDRQGLEGDQGAPLRMTLSDAFHRWRFYYAR